MRELDGLRPFGIGNPEPLFLTRGVEVTSRRDFNGGTRLQLKQAGKSVTGVMFGGDRRAATGEGPAAVRPPSLTVGPEAGRKVDLVYRLSENEWNGTRSVELRLVDTKACA